MQLSKFFALAEMTRSDTAQRENIPNEPNDAVTSALKALCTAVLDPLRESTQASIAVTSGYRSPALNARIGGAANSQHVDGKAADIQSASMSVLELFKAVIRLGLPFDQVIYEAKNKTTKWVHVSHSTPARGHILVAEFGDDGRARAYRSVSREAALAMTEPATRSRTALTYEEMADEPELEAAFHDSTPAPAPKPRGKQRAAKKSPKTRRKPARKKPAARKRKAKALRRKASRGKKSRGKAKKRK